MSFEHGIAGLSAREKAIARSLLHGFFDPIRLESNSIVRGITRSMPYVHGRLLDLGCGDMPYAALFQERVSRYIGTDLRPNPAIPPDVVSDSLRLPFKAQSFDTVLCTQVLEHVRDPFLTMGEISRVLRPGGHVILTAPAAWPLHEEPRDFFRYTLYGLRELASRSHLQPVMIVERGGGIQAIGQMAATMLYDTVGKRALTRVPMRAVVAPLLSIVAALDRLLYFPGFTLGYTMVARKV